MAVRSLGTLTLDLALKIGAFDAGMEKAAKLSEKRLNEIKATASKIGTGIGLAFAGAATGLGVLVKNAIDTADDMGKLSQQTGIAAEALSGLDYAAKLGGVDDIGESLIKLNKTLAEAASGSEAQAEAFRKLGISFTDSTGKARDSLTVFREIADRFQTMEDGAEKTGLAMEFFGRSGAALIPVLNGGSKGLDEMDAKARQLGLTLTDETTKAAEAFNDAFSDLKLTFVGIGRSIAGDLTPALNELAETINSPEFRDGLAAIIKSTAEAANGVANLIAKIGSIGNQRELVEAEGRVASIRAQIEKIESASGLMNVFGDADKELYKLNNQLLLAEHNLERIRKGGSTFLPTPDASLADYSPNLSDVPTVFDLIKTKVEETKGPAKELKETFDAIGALTDDFVDEGTSIFGGEELSGLDFGAFEEQIYRGADAMQYLKDRTAEFQETFSGAFEAYAASIENVGAMLGGDLVTALDSAISKSADLAANVILWGEDGTEALKALGRSILTDLLSSLIKAGAQMAINFALQKAFSAATTTTAATEAETLAAAWAPAAVSASIATLGGADLAGIAAFTAAQASGKAIGAGGFAEGGFTGHGPLNEVAGFVHRREGVLSADALAAAANAINDPEFWGNGKGAQVNIIAEPGTVVVRRESDGALLARLAPPLLEMVDVDQAARMTSGRGRTAQATGNKFGLQPRSVR